MRIISRMNVGGPAWQVDRLCRHLPEARYETFLFSGPVGTDEADYLERAPGISVQDVPGLGPGQGFLSTLRAFRTLRNAMQAIRPQVVHTHTSKAGVLGRIAAKSAGVPAIVHTYHGHVLHGYFAASTSKVIALVERGLAKFSDSLIAVGENVRDDLVNAKISDPTHFEVIPGGVEAWNGPSRETARKELAVDFDASMLLFAGRLTSIKRPDRLAEVYRKVRATHGQTILYVAGEGEKREALERLADEFPGDVRLVGWSDNVDLLLAASDVALMASDSEGTPIFLLEAARAGVPAVATDVGSVSEVVIDGLTGYVTEPSSAALASRVCDVLASPSIRSNMSVAAMSHVAANYSVGQLVRKHQNLYERLIQDKSSNIA